MLENVFSQYNTELLKSRIFSFGIYLKFESKDLKFLYDSFLILSLALVPCEMTQTSYEPLKVFTRPGLSAPAPEAGRKRLQEVSQMRAQESWGDAYVALVGHRGYRVTSPGPQGVPGGEQKHAYEALLWEHKS